LWPPKPVSTWHADPIFHAAPEKPFPRTIIA